MEQAYRLCPRCERHLKRTLNKVKTNILGSKLKQIGTKGLQAFDLHVNEETTKNVVHKKRLTFARISLATLILISLLQSITITNQLSITKSQLDSVFNTRTTTTILTMLSYVSAVKIMILESTQFLLDLPYISFGVACLQTIINYVYAYMSGDIWRLLPAEFIELIESNANEIDRNPGSSTLTSNISGSFLSVFLLFIFGLEWGPVLSLLLWSFGMIMPSVIRNTADARQNLLLDILQVKCFLDYELYVYH